MEKETKIVNLEQHFYTPQNKYSSRTGCSRT